MKYLITGVITDRWSSGLRHSLGKRAIERFGGSNPSLSAKNMKRYLLYLIRWQLSTPILAPIMFLMSASNPLIAASIANLIGGLIFFWIDKIIFMTGSPFSMWEVKEDVVCSDCGKKSRGYRLVKAKKYNKIKEDKPKFRCEICSKEKSKELKSKGINH